MLILNDNLITEIPEELYHPFLKELWMVNNNVWEVDPEKIFQQFPNLKTLVLRGNPLTQDNVKKLKTEAKIHQDRPGQIGGPPITVYAPNLTRGLNIKSAKK